MKNKVRAMTIVNNDGNFDIRTIGLEGSVAFFSDQIAFIKELLGYFGENYPHEAPEDSQWSVRLITAVDDSYCIVSLGERTFPNELPDEYHFLKKLLQYLEEQADKAQSASEELRSQFAVD